MNDGGVRDDFRNQLSSSFNNSSRATGNPVGIAQSVFYDRLNPFLPLSMECHQKGSLVSCVRHQVKKVSAADGVNMDEVWVESMLEFDNLFSHLDHIVDDAGSGIISKREAMDWNPLVFFLIGQGRVTLRGNHREFIASCAQ